MSLSVKQTVQGFAGSGASQTTTSFSTATGNLLVVGVRVGGSNTVSSVKNALGVSFATLTSQVSSPVLAQLFYLKNITGNASEAITVAFSGTGPNAACFVWEIAGADISSPLDVDTGSHTNAGVSPITSASFSTLHPDEILLAFSTINLTGVTTYAAQAGYTLDTQAGVWPVFSGVTGYTAAQHEIVSSIQSSVTSSMTFTNVGGSGSLGLICVASFIAQSYGVSGNAGVAGATVSWSGGPSSDGSVTADGSGNYNTGEILAPGSYIITPSLTNYTFSPPNASETISNADITGVNFTATQTKVATPTFSPVGGTYSSTQSITLSSTDSGLSGFAMTYTTDGTTPIPGSHGTIYSGPITVSSTQTIKVVASATGYANSNEADATYTITSGGSAWSPIDSRIYKPNFATYRTVNGAQIDDVQTSSNSAIPGVDSRKEGAPIASGSYPQNSRVAPPFGEAGEP